MIMVSLGFLGVVLLVVYFIIMIRSSHDPEKELRGNNVIRILDRYNNKKKGK